MWTCVAVGVRVVAAVAVALLGSVASGEPEPEPKSTRPVRPAWLVGIWETTTSDGKAAIVLGADGTVSYTAKVGTEESGQSGGTWVVQAGELVVTEGGTSLRMRIERLAASGAEPGVRFLAPGTEATAPRFMRRPDPAPRHPVWMGGTWETRHAEGATRLVLLPDGTGRDVIEEASDITAHPVRWRMEAGTLHVIDGDVTMSQEIDFVPDDEGRLKMWLLGGVAVRISWPPTLASHEGPLVGRWARVDSLVEEHLILDPFGGAERRRVVEGGVLVEPGRFWTSRGARGDVLTLESDAGRRSAWLYRIEGTRLLLTSEEGPRRDVFERVAGSPAIVAQEARNAAAAAGDTLAEHRVRYGARARVRSAPPAPPGGPQDPALPPSAPDPDDPEAAIDPAPHDVIVGAEVLARTTFYVGASEETLARSREGNIAIDAFAPGARERAEPRSDQPRLWLSLVFEPHGRVMRHAVQFGGGGQAGETETLEHGKYEIVGDVVTVHFPGQPARALRVAAGGLHLYDGPMTLMIQRRWIEGTLAPPR